jgi:signal transduction histidine kinase
VGKPGRTSPGPHGLIRVSRHRDEQRLVGQAVTQFLRHRQPALPRHRQVADGFETARHIRAQDRSRHTPIIFVTAYDSDEFPVPAAYELGAVDYLVKPLVPAILRAKVAVFVDLVLQAARLRDLERERAARAAAEEENRRIEEFLATLAHELRSPLAPIRNGLQILRSGPGTAGWAEVCGLMERQVANLVRMVDDLMDVARTGRGKLRLKAEKLDLRAAAEAAAETAGPVCQAAGHRLHVHLPGGPVHVEADQTRLVQVLTNLLANAAKYTPAGGDINLVVAVAERTAVVRVKDGGVGISAEMLPKVFDLFAQADRSLDQAQGGLGIGLALVKRLVEMHGGTVEAKSDGPGTGSEFVVRLPLTGA